MFGTIRIAPRLALAAALVAGLGAGCGVDAEVSRALGARCDSSAECDDRCLPPGERYPGGFCSATCETSGDCAADARCVESEGGVCLLECLADQDCAFLGDGWRCLVDAQHGDPARETVQVCRGA